MSYPSTLISFIGRQDPFNRDGQDGPLLTLLKRCDETFHSIVLIHTTKDEFKGHAERTRDEILKHYSRTNVRLIPLELNDPTDHVEVFRELKACFEAIKGDLKGNLYISLTSGTPQMHIASFLLVASNELSATMLYMPDPREQQSAIRKIIPWEGELPEILPRIPKGIISYQISKDIEEVKKRLGIVGISKSLNRAVSKALRYAPYNETVMIRGETGTGKELIARLIHEYSKRAGKKFFAFNCSAITETIAESELFGHKKGAFTGAVSDKQGYFSVASGGTLFLDEIGDLSSAIQAKLLRVLETNEIYPVGATQPEKVDVRIICATHRDLEQMVEEGKFREDLYHRLNVLRIDMPSLRERLEDIPLLARHFLEQFCEKNGLKKSITERALQKLCKHRWNGNIRELKTFIWRLAIDCPKELIDYSDFELPNEQYSEIINSLPPNPYEGFSLEKVIEQIRDYYYKKALEITNDNKSKASRLLGISPQAVDKWTRKN